MAVSSSAVAARSRSTTTTSVSSSPRSPYQVNKSELVKAIADLINDKKIDGISGIADESNRKGIRIVIDIKRDANSGVVLNKLYKMSALQSSFSINNIALVKGRPQLLNLRDLIELFIEHRHDVVYRRTQFELRKAEERVHILEGLIIAVDNIDEVIRIIRAASEPQEAIEKLMERFSLSLIQARASWICACVPSPVWQREKLKEEYAALMQGDRALEGSPR